MAQAERALEFAAKLAARERKLFSHNQVWTAGEPACMG
jgi:hypothetical protein